MNITVLYHVFYFERELFLLDINGFYSMVYRGSGLNGGKKGRILPYMWLMDKLPRFSDARNGVVPGYIFKDFFYRGFYQSHGKKLSNFHDSVETFAYELEVFLKDYDGTKSKNFNSDEDFNNILNIAKEINQEMKDLIAERKIFDWFSLSNC